MTFYCLSPRGSFHRSTNSGERDAPLHRSIPHKTNRHLVSLDYDRDLCLSAGIGEHFIKLVRVFLYIEIDGHFPIGCPSLLAEGSGVCTINNDLIWHDAIPPFEKIRYAPQ